MLEIAVALGLLALFSGCTTLGFVFRARIPETHRSKDAMQLIQLVMSLLVTFTAIVLGLLTTSVKNNYDKAEQDRVHFAGELTQLDRCMRDYGSGSELVRGQLQSYTGAVIASTWPSESPPQGVTYPDISRMKRVGPSPVLARLIDQVGIEILKLDPADAFHQKLAARCESTYKDVLSDRWAVVDDVYSSMATPFFCAVTFWLALVFAGFGLCAPPVPLVWIVIGLCAISVASALVIVADMNMPYGGIFQISSAAMRTALAHMQAQAP